MPTNVFPSAWSQIYGTPLVTVSAVGYAQGAGLANNGCNFGPDSAGGTTVTQGQAEADSYLASHGGGLAVLVNGQSLLIVPSGGNAFRTPYQLGQTSTADYSVIVESSKPELTLGVGTNTGADFDASTSGTQTGGLQELIDAIANSTVFSTNMHDAKVLPGAVLCAVPVEVSAFYLVLRGSGYEASSIKANFAPTSGENLIYWPIAPGTPAIGDGTHVHDIAFDLNGKAFGYGVAVGYPGGHSSDIEAAAFLFERCATKGTGGATIGATFSSVEDGMLFDCNFSGAASGAQGPSSGVYGLEWIVTNGSAVINCGNYGCILCPSSDMELTDVVFTELTIGCQNVPAGTGVRGKLVLKGRGFNGFPGAAISGAITPLVYVNLPSSSPQIQKIVSEGINWAITSNATQNSGYIGGPGADYVFLRSTGDNWSTAGSLAAYSPLFGLLSYGGSDAAGYGTVSGGELTAQTLAQWLNSTPYVQGDVVDNTNGWYSIALGAVTTLLETLP